MKKILAMMLTAAMMLSMGTAAMADGETVTPPSVTVDGTTHPDVTEVTINKSYIVTENSTENAQWPTETFTLVPANDETHVNSVTGSDATVVPAITADMITPVTYENTESTTDADATEEGAQGLVKGIVVDLPTYDKVGIYTYWFKEVNNNIAGVEYFGNWIKLVVTVMNSDNPENGEHNVRVAAVHCEAEGEKDDTFENTYSAGDLSITKTVTGNLGDRNKEFTVTVTFSSEKEVKSAITYKERVTDTEDKSLTFAKAEGANVYTASATLYLTHEDTIEFTNLPYGVTYTVVENDYVKSTDDYDYTKYTGTDVDGTVEYTENSEANTGVTGTVSDGEENVAIENNKGEEVDTGISVDSIPYLAMLGVVAVGGAGVVVSKKRRSED